MVAIVLHLQAIPHDRDLSKIRELTRPESPRNLCSGTSGGRIRKKSKVFGWMFRSVAISKGVGAPSVVESP
jgi:hypothetical protein